MTDFSEEQYRHPYVVEEQTDYPEGWWIKNEITEAAIKLDNPFQSLENSKWEAYRLCNVMNRVYADLYDYIKSLPMIGKAYERS